MYPNNMILRYSNKRETEIKLEVLEVEKIPKKDSSQPLWHYFLFLLLEIKK